MRALLLSATLLATAPAFADTIRCTAVGGDATVTLDVAIAEDRRAITAARLDAELDDRLAGPSLSTAGDEPHLIAGQESADERFSIDIADPGDTWIVLRLRLVRDVAYDRLFDDETDADWPAVVGGTLAVMGGGAWPVTCTGW